VRLAVADLGHDRVGLRLTGRPAPQLVGPVAPPGPDGHRHDGDGNPVELAGDSVVVLRRRPDGSRRFAIDSPGWTA